MRDLTREVRRGAALLVLLAAAGCGRGAGDDDGQGAVDPAGGAPRTHFVREYVFLGARAGAPLVVPLAFRSTDADGRVDRVARAWVAHGSAWEEFVDERWRTPGTAGVWRVLPRGDLRVAAQGPDEVQEFWYQRGERRLRLQMGGALSAWAQGDDARFRVQQGRLTLGDEVIPGAVLQLLKVDRAGTARRSPEPADWLFLAGGDSLRLVLARVGGAPERFGTSFGWTGRAEGERAWETVEIGPTELRPLPEARRDIPLGWQFRIPEAGVHGQVRALGYDTVLGAERGGRRAVEARYTVQGWVEIDGRRSDVVGTARHSQR